MDSAGALRQSVFITLIDIIALFNFSFASDTGEIILLTFSLGEELFETTFVPRL